jgi:hypothetical protein
VTNAAKTTLSEKNSKKPDDPKQSKRFIEAAKEAEADETESGADSAFKKAAIPKPRSDRDR